VINDHPCIYGIAFLKFSIHSKIFKSNCYFLLERISSTCEQPYCMLDFLGFWQLGLFCFFFFFFTEVIRTLYFMRKGKKTRCEGEGMYTHVQEKKKKKSAMALFHKVSGSQEYSPKTQLGGRAPFT
jgi:hypothetical protein